MFVWLFQGNLGEGKTFCASVLAHHFRAKAKQFGLPVDLYSNYGLKESKPMRDYKDFYHVAKSANSIVLLDEAHINLDSRMFAKGSNIYMTQFFFYLRKLHCSLFMTTPSLRNLDSRIRNLTNILVDCHKWGGGFQYHIYDLQGEKLLRKAYLPAGVAKEIFKMDLYDTDGIVRNVAFPSTERAFNDFLDKIEAIRENAGPSRIEDEDEVTAELIENMPDEVQAEDLN